MSIAQNLGLFYKELVGSGVPEESAGYIVQMASGRILGGDLDSTHLVQSDTSRVPSLAVTVTGWEQFNDPAVQDRAREILAKEKDQ